MTESGEIVHTPTKGRAKEKGGQGRAEGDANHRRDGDASDQPGIRIIESTDRIVIRFGDRVRVIIL